MGLKNVMKYLQKQAAVTSVTSEKNQTLQPEPNVYAGCTSVTSVTSQIDKTQSNVQFVPTGEASNDPELTTTKPPAPPAPAPRGEAYQRWHNTWRAQADAYYSHHFTCAVCIASGKGYGERCDLGETLWARYCEASDEADRG